MSDLPVEQSVIDKEIVSAAIDCTPEENFDFDLALTYVSKPDQDLGGVSHMLTCLDGDGGNITPSEDVFNAVQKLNRLFGKNGIAWHKITYHIYCDDDDRWRFEANFVYGDEAPTENDTIQ